MNTKFIKLDSFKLIFLLLLVFVLASCDKEEMNDPIMDQPILFQYSYTNFAWVGINTGWFIDNKGQIRGYSHTSNWIYEDGTGYITQDNLLSNYNQTDTLLGEIDLDKLTKKAKLIEDSLDGELSELDCPGADMGTYALYCYFWDSEKNKFKMQLLHMTGDCEQQNTSNEAKELIEFLYKYIN